MIREAGTGTRMSEEIPSTGSIRKESSIRARRRLLDDSACCFDQDTCTFLPTK